MPKYRDTAFSAGERARDLVSRMTCEEKIAQSMNHAPAITRLGVKAFDYWSECLHGVARAGTATVFPQAIGLAAVFDPEFHKEIAGVISDEARAKANEYDRMGDHEMYKNLFFFSPNVNLFRDPRWGRGQETYGEDPYLSGKLGAAFVQGIQGDHADFLKAVATVKHYAVHSGPEGMRHGFNAEPSRKDLYESYLPAFRTTVIEGGVRCVMGAYNRLYGEPCCASPLLIGEILREHWGFTGVFCSDAGAMDDIDRAHRVTASSAESAAISLKAGCDLNVGGTYRHLEKALEMGWVTEEMLDRALCRLFAERMALGEFDEPDKVPYASIPYEINDCETHRALNREAARKSFVLLKNDGVLPLHHNRTIAVIGPTAEETSVLVGNYNGRPNHGVTILEGLHREGGSMARIYYAKGCELAMPANKFLDTSTLNGNEAVSAARRADVVVLCLGYTPQMEGEEGDAYNADMSGDRRLIELPPCQQQLLETVTAVGKPVVLVLSGGSPVAIPWAAKNVAAILETWYPGGEGGLAVADVLFGVSPSGRLPVTFPMSTEDLPPFREYSMKGRTYRFCRKEPLFPFGFGLSYTRFAYSDLRVPRQIEAGREVPVSVCVQNIGSVESDEVVQIYLRAEDGGEDDPRWSLCGVKRVHLRPGQSAAVELTIDPRATALVDQEGRFMIEPGAFTVFAGGAQPDSRSQQLGAAEVLSARLEIRGDSLIELPR